MKLLLIDDEQDILDIVAEIIVDLGLGVEVLKANTSEEAVALEPQADAILSDIMVPNKAILDRLIRDTKLPVVRITGYFHIKNDMTIKKPFCPTDIESVVRKLITLSELQKKAAV